MKDRYWLLMQTQEEKYPRVRRFETKEEADFFIKALRIVNPDIIYNLFDLEKVTLISSYS